MTKLTAKQALVVEAQNLGIDVKKSWTAKRIQEEINKVVPSKTSEAVQRVGTWSRANPVTLVVALVAFVLLIVVLTSDGFLRTLIVSMMIIALIASLIGLFTGGWDGMKAAWSTVDGFNDKSICFAAKFTWKAVVALGKTIAAPVTAFFSKEEEVVEEA